MFRCSAGIDGLRDQGVINEIVCKFILDYTKLFGELTEPGPFTIPYIHQVGFTKLYFEVPEKVLKGR